MKFKHSYLVTYYKYGETVSASVSANSEQDAAEFIKKMTSGFGGIIRVTQNID